MVLDEIVANKRIELAESQRLAPHGEMMARAQAQSPALDFAGALRGPGVRLIAEVKKASPSRGLIRADFDPVTIALTYANGGAAAISVLTDEKYFQGRLDHLAQVRAALPHTPLLRKDFIIDPYQAHEARAFGADAILLIVAILSPAQLRDLLELSRALGMASLVETHDEAELNTALASGAGIIGINNRNLKTMTVDLSVTGRLRGLIPPDRIVVSESGIKNRRDIELMQRLGVHAVLIGETLMASSDIAGKMEELFGQG